MTNEALEALWSYRLALVERFISNPEDYKECDQCRSISIKRAARCHLCGTYRFQDDPERVRATAREMGTNPYPFTAPVVPRIGFTPERRWFRLVRSNEPRLQFEALEPSEKET